MAASTKKRKRRMKRQLQKRFKQTSGTVFKPWFDPVIVESNEPPKEYRAHILYKGKYEVENQAYQVQLDTVYGGKVTSIERFINPKSIILHECSECDKEFYSRPQWLLTKEDQRHVCYFSPTPTGKIKKVVRIVTDQDITKMCKLAEQGISVAKIAVEIGVSRPTVTKYLKQAGVK